MNKPDMLAELAEVVRLSDAVSFSYLDWGWRNDDEVPGSIFTNSFGGMRQAVAMCPRYGKDKFAADASYIAAAVNFLRTHHAALEAMARDVCRYRWLRDRMDANDIERMMKVDQDGDESTSLEVDQAMDYAMRAENSHD